MFHLRVQVNPLAKNLRALREGGTTEILFRSIPFVCAYIRPSMQESAWTHFKTKAHKCLGHGEIRLDISELEQTLAKFRTTPEVKAHKEVILSVQAGVLRMEAAANSSVFCTVNIKEHTDL